MGASFRNIDEIRQLAGCDRLTISPGLLDVLEKSNENLEQKLFSQQPELASETKLSESSYRWAMNEDAMATEKLAEGIRNFTIDQIKLEKQLAKLL